MYLDFFNLKEFPFSIASDAKYFFESDIHAEALANMLYTIQQRKGMVLVTGEVGAGKTFLASMLAERLGRSSLVVSVKHPPDSAKQMLRAVAEGIGVRIGRNDDKLTLVNELENKLQRHFRRDRLVAVILDEVQDLPDEAMEQIRLMWNWEQQGQRLVQLVLVGQPELRDRLQEPKWESLQQRIVLSYHLGALSAADTAKYVLHRRKIAASNGCPLRFTIRALEDVYEVTKGIPRLINILCDNALLSAYASNTTKITSGVIAKVVQNMTTWTLNPPSGMYEEDDSAEK
jgi:general secretion pathway protein A